MERIMDVDALTEDELLEAYNYDSFVPQKFGPWLRFNESPPVGKPAPDFALWRLEERSQVMFSEIWSANMYTIVEFGSFT